MSAKITSLCVLCGGRFTLTSNHVIRKHKCKTNANMCAYILQQSVQKEQIEQEESLHFVIEDAD